MDGRKFEDRFNKGYPAGFETVNWRITSNTASRVYVAQHYIVTSELHVSA